MSTLHMFLSILWQLPFKMVRITFQTEISVPVVCMEQLLSTFADLLCKRSDFQGTNFLFLKFADVVYVFVCTSVASFEDDCIVRSNWNRIFQR